MYIALGAFAGILAGLLGVGGGLVIVPVLTFIFTARHLSDAHILPYSLGFVYLPALLGISAASVATAPLGAKLAHSLPIDKLKKIFTLLLLAMGTKMLLSLM